MNFVINYIPTRNCGTCFGNSFGVLTGTTLGNSAVITVTKDTTAYGRFHAYQQCRMHCGVVLQLGHQFLNTNKYIIYGLALLSKRRAMVSETPFKFMSLPYGKSLSVVLGLPVRPSAIRPFLDIFIYLYIYFYFPSLDLSHYSL